MSFKPFKPLIHNIKTLFLSNNQMEIHRKENEQECLQLWIYAMQAQPPRPAEMSLG